MSITLTDLGHAQLPTPLHVDNSTAVGFSKGKIKQKIYKAIDMRFYWIQDRTHCGQLLIYWCPGSTNIGEYFTKHQYPAHHFLMQHIYLHPTTSLDNYVITNILLGCVNMTERVPPGLSPIM